MRINFKFFRAIDWLLYVIPIILTIIGIAIIYSLTYYSNIKLFYYQIFFAVIGIIMMIIFSLIDYRHFKSMSLNIYVVGIILLLIVFILGKTSFGATRWISLGLFDLQPSELMKLFIVIFLSSYLADKIGEISFKNVIISLLATAIPAVLVIIQPDLGSAIIIILAAIAIILSCKIKITQLLIYILIAMLCLPLGWFMLKDYQKQRLMTFMEPSSDPYGSGYNVSQSLITVGSGGLWGQGFGRGAQSQLNFLPVAHTDFVFAGYAEATGFVGSVVLLFLFFLLILKIINVAKISKDNFGLLIAIGIASIIFFQVIINIGMNIGLMPVTGIPLPFVSYGGSSLIFMDICIGILQSIYLRQRKFSF